MKSLPEIRKTLSFWFETAQPPVGQDGEESLVDATQRLQKWDAVWHHCKDQCKSEGNQKIEPQWPQSWNDGVVLAKEAITSLAQEKTENEQQVVVLRGAVKQAQKARAKAMRWYMSSVVGAVLLVWIGLWLLAEQMLIPGSLLAEIVEPVVETALSWMLVGLWGSVSQHWPVVKSCRTM